MDLLGIASLRPGANPNNPQAPNAVNTNEAKANPYPNLPDPLSFKNGKKVTTGAEWRRRRTEILEDFSREIYGRIPKNTPRVKWEATKTTEETKGDVAVVTRELVGHVDNSSYPALTVSIAATLTTCARRSAATKQWPIRLTCPCSPPAVKEVFGPDGLVA